MKKIFWVVLVSAFFLLAACSGGGGTVEYLVSTNVGSGGSVIPENSTVAEGSTVSFTITPDTGYSIDAVTGCGGTLGGNTYTTGSITGDCTVTASFSLSSYTVIFQDYDGTELKVESVNHADSATAPADPSRTGYSFSGWSPSYTNITSNLTVTAQYTVNTYTVTPEAGNHGTIDPATAQSVEHDGSTSFTIIPYEGYSIDEVTGCGGTLEGNTYTTGPITADCLVTATFAESTYSISGIIEPGPYHMIDTTSNDSRAEYESNSKYWEAQLISNPVLLGGFVTAEPTEVSGDRYAYDVDPVDVFDTELFAGQRATLYVDSIDDSDADIQLALTRQSEPLFYVDLAEGEDVLQVTAPSDDSYYIWVMAEKGAAGYLLSVGETAHLSDMGYNEPIRPLVPARSGTVIIELEPDTSPPTLLLQGETPAQRAQDLGRRLGGSVTELNQPGYYSLRVDDPQAALNNIPAADITVAAQGVRTALNVPDDPTLAMVRALNRQPGIRQARPDYLRNLQGLQHPNDTLYEKQWHYPLMSLPEAWYLTQGSEDVVVAVVDSGVDIDHPDLAGKLTGDGWDFIEDAPLEVLNRHTHGTHVAGTVGADTDNDIGVAGAGWNVSIMPLRACDDDGSCSSKTIIDAVRYAAGLDPERQPGRVADVINLSLGGAGSSKLEAAVYQEVCDAGVLVVAAAGNHNNAELMYPASYSCVFSVAALGPDSTRASYSNFNEEVDVTAPGGDIQSSLQQGILSTDVEADYAWMQGTSMSAPHVAGVFGLLRSIDNSLTPEVVRAWLHEGMITDQLDEMNGESRTDEHGYGLLNAKKGVQQADSDLGPMLTVSPGRLRFDPATAPQKVTVGVTEEGITVIDVTVTKAWLQVSDLDADDDTGLGDYTVSVNADSLDSGLYSGRVDFAASDDSMVSVDIRLMVPVIGDGVVFTAGPQRVRLMEIVDQGVIKRDALEVDIVGGVYHYDFTDVPRGDYYVTAGSRLDNRPPDCSPGEACGTYKDFLLAPVVVTVDDADHTEVNFVVDFRTALDAVEAGFPSEPGQAISSEEDTNHALFD